jgi:hypothetical protein
MLDQKAGRAGVLGGVNIPKLDDQTLVVFSGHDTQLGALGGILNAHWNPEGGIVWDDMPPGAALIFDLVAIGPGDYGVRVGFAAMALEQFRTEQPIEGAIKVTPVLYPGCSRRGCIMPLVQFESLALTLDAQGFVVDGWDASSSPLPLALLKDPNWTDPRCLGR